MRYNKTAKLRRALLPVLLCSLGMVAQPSMACRVLTKKEAEAGREERIEAFKAGVRSLHKEAEFVFVGRMSKLTFHEEGDGTGVGSGEFRRVYQAAFDGIDSIKGTYVQAQPLTFTINAGRVVIDCDRPPFSEALPSMYGTAEWYLVYGRDGKILRANQLSGELHTLNGRNEADLVRGFQKIGAVQ